MIQSTCDASSTFNLLDGVIAQSQTPVEAGKLEFDNSTIALASMGKKPKGQCYGKKGKNTAASEMS
jgi:hypothetical protein